jgi:hypothetical protein
MKDFVIRIAEYLRIQPKFSVSLLHERSSPSYNSSEALYTGSPYPALVTLSFLTLERCCVSGSGTRCLLIPGPWIDKRIKIRIRNEHPGSYFRELKKIFALKILKFLDADPDLGSGIFLTPDRDGKIRIWDKHPGSATLLE